MRPNQSEPVASSGGVSSSDVSSAGAVSAGLLLSLLPWVGVVAAAAIVGVAVGTSGIVGSNEAPTELPAAFTLPEPVSASVCPGGAFATELPQGTRVLAIARSADNDWVGVRNTENLAATVWVPTMTVVVDAEQPELATLPVQACPTVRFPRPAVKPTHTATPKPTDSKAPSITSISADPDFIFNLDPTIIRVKAADNVGVTKVTLKWSGEFSGSAAMKKVGNEWRYTFTPPTDGGGMITFTATAKDAAGNTSAPKKTTVEHQYFG
jgi:hypothetical protein